MGCGSSTPKASNDPVPRSEKDTKLDAAGTKKKGKNKWAKKAFVISEVADLPSGLVDEIERSGIPHAGLDKHLPLLANAMRFSHKARITVAADGGIAAFPAEAKLVKEFGAQFAMDGTVVGGYDSSDDEKPVPALPVPAPTGSSPGRSRTASLSASQRRASSRSSQSPRSRVASVSAGSVGDGPVAALRVSGRTRKPSISLVRERSAQDLKRFDPAMVAKGSAFASSVAAADLDNTVRVGALRGEGGFGKVFEAVVSGRTIALKKMDHSTDKAVSVNMNEIGCLAELRHKHVVNMERAIVCTPQGATRPQCWIFMEFMKGGTLQQASKASKFTVAHVAYVARSVLSALVFMHSRCYAHRDLKSANIMLSIEAEVKLIDFGLCTRIPMPPKSRYDHATEGHAKFPNHARDGGGIIHMAGSPFWMPPEMIWRAPHGLAVDIWSLGISLWEMAEGKPPNAKNKLKALFTAATEGITPLARHSNGTAFGDFLGGALKLSPTERPTAASLEESPFLTEAASVAEMSDVLRQVFVADALQVL